MIISWFLNVYFEHWFLGKVINRQLSLYTVVWPNILTKPVTRAEPCQRKEYKQLSTQTRSGSNCSPVISNIATDWSMWRKIRQQICLVAYCTTKRTKEDTALTDFPENRLSKQTPAYIHLMYYRWITCHYLIGQFKKKTKKKNLKLAQIYFHPAFIFFNIIYFLVSLFDQMFPHESHRLNIIQWTFQIKIQLCWATGLLIHPRAKVGI